MKCHPQESQSDVPRELEKWGFRWVRREHTSRAVIFDQFQDGRPCGFVVCRNLRHKRDREIGGRLAIRAGSFRVPGESAFGISAWQYTPKGLDAARARFDSLNA